MKSILLTHASEEYAPLADLGEPGKMEWCKLHGFDYRRVNESLTCWDRIELWFTTLLAYDLMFFMGADTLITNKWQTLRTYMGDDTDMAIAPDGGGINCDVFAIRSNKSTRQLMLNLSLNAKRMGENEQQAMGAALAGIRSHRMLWDFLPGRPLDDGAPCGIRLHKALDRMYGNGPLRVNLVRQRELNAYPCELYGKTIPDESWRPGDFVAHFPGLPFEKRLIGMQKILTFIDP